MSHTQPISDWSWHELGFHSPQHDTHKNLFSSRGLRACLQKIGGLFKHEKNRIEIYAQPGSGATTLLKLLQRNHSDHPTHYLCAHHGLSPTNLVKAIFQKLDIPKGVSIVQSPISLLKFLTGQRIEARLLIDHSESLPEQTLHFIQDLCNHQGKSGGPLRFVMVKNAHQAAPSRQESLVLPALSFEETKQYIQGLIPEGMFSPGFEKSVRLIYQDTQGNLGKIISRAPLFLQHAQQKPVARLMRQPRTGLSLTALITCMGLMVAGFEGAQALLRRERLWTATLPAEQARPHGLVFFSTPSEQTTTLGPFANVREAHQHVQNDRSVPLAVQSMRKLKEDLANPMQLMPSMLGKT